MKEKMIEVKNLEKSFNRRKVIDGLNIQVEKGECFGLLGHNGARKCNCVATYLDNLYNNFSKNLSMGVEIYGNEEKA